MQRRSVGPVNTSSSIATEARSLVDRMLRPKSVALVGASADGNKPSGMLLGHLREAGSDVEIYPVNPRYPDLGDLVVYGAVTDIPTTPDLAVIAVGTDQVLPVVESCAERGVGAIMLLSGGFGEGGTGGEGRSRAEALERMCGEHGIRLLGPNTVGLVNFADSIPLTFADWYRSDTGARGHTAVLTQSGSVGGLIFRLLQRHGLGIHYWVALGNELDLDAADLLAGWTSDDLVHRVVCFIEGLTDGPKFVRAAQRFIAARKELVVLKSSGSDAATRAARSHTGKLAGSGRAYRAVLRELGAIQVSSLEELAHVVALLESSAHRPSGNRVAVLSASGGGCSVIAGHAEAAGLQVPQLPQDVTTALAGAIPPYGSRDNPVDLSADVVHRPEILHGTLSAVAVDPGIDTWVVFGRPILDRYAADLVDARVRLGLPLLACSGVPCPPDVTSSLRAGGIAVLEDPELTMRALARVATTASSVRRVGPLPELPRRDPEPATTSLQTVHTLAQRGIRFPRTWRITDLDELDAGVDTVDATEPVVVKIVAEEIPHKSDVGCVRMGITGAYELRKAAREVLAVAERIVPRDRIEAIEVQSMAPAGVELLASVYDDPDFGPMLMLGAGGVLTELLDDVSVRMLPTTDDSIREMIGELRVSTLLRGFRGSGPADIDALVATVATFAACYLDDSSMPPTELNPIIVGSAGAGAVAVDILVGAGR